MKKMENKYFTNLDIIDCFKRGDLGVTRREQKLIQKLSDVYQTDRTNRITESIFQSDHNLRALLREIDQETAYLNSLIENFQKSNKGLSIEFITRKTLVYQDQIKKLDQLKNDIIHYQRMHSISLKQDRQELIDTSVYSLATEFFRLPKYFGKPLAQRDSKGDEHFRLNEDVISQVYEILEDDQTVKELQDGVGILEQEQQYREILTYCDEANSNKDVMFKNIDKIALYNQIKSELQRLLETSNDPKYNRIDERIHIISRKLKPYLSSSVKRFFHGSEFTHLLDQRKKLMLCKQNLESLKSNIAVRKAELATVKKELSANGLATVLSKVDTEDLIGTYAKKHLCSLSSNFSRFTSRKELEEYYQRIDKNTADGEEMLQRLAQEKRVLFETMSDRARKLFEKDYETCHNLVKLSRAGMRGDITPSIALFILNALVTMDNTSVYDMGITDQEYEQLVNYYDKILMNAYENYNSEFISIMNPTNKRVTFTK